MERQKPVNSVQHADAYSQALIESYSQWMGGHGFQQSDPLTEDGIPAEQKQGGESTGAFTTAIGTVPAPENDSSTVIPTITVVNTDDGSSKDPKSNAGSPDPAVNLRVGAGVKQSHGATIRDVTKVAKEEVEPAVEAKGSCKKCGGDHLTEDCKESKGKCEEYQWKVVGEALEVLGELTEAKYHVRGVKLSEHKEQQRKMTDRLFEYSKKVQEKKDGKK